MHGTRTTLRDAAAVFGARQTKHIAQHPQQRGVTVDIDVVRRTVDFDGEGHGELLFIRTISEALVAVTEPLLSNGRHLNHTLDTALVVALNNLPEAKPRIGRESEPRPSIQGNKALRGH